MKMRQLFEFCNYYSFIDDQTPKSVLIDLDVDELTKLFECITKGGKSDSLGKSLCSKIESGLTQFGGGGVFARMSSRSPKDACDKPGAVRRRVLQALRPMISKFSFTDRMSDRNAVLSDDEANQCLIALRRSFFIGMAVTSIDEILELFSYSSRIISDLKRALGMYI
jgi:hypothetical protein